MLLPAKSGDDTTPLIQIAGGQGKEENTRETGEAQNNYKLFFTLTNLLVKVVLVEGVQFQVLL